MNRQIHILQDDLGIVAEGINLLTSETEHHIMKKTMTFNANTVRTTRDDSRGSTPSPAEDLNKCQVHIRLRLTHFSLLRI